MEIANIFWYGELTKLEKACVKSFVNHGFHVKLWSYDDLQVEGAESCDANLIFPKEKLTSFTSTILNGKELKKARATSFSDMFRYYLINKFGGWWFDADCICLKDAEHFEKLRAKELTVGYIERVNSNIANGVLYMDDKTSSLLIEDFEKFISTNTDRSWEVYGPTYITNFISKYKLDANILPYYLFYAINWNEFDFFINPKLIEVGREMIKHSYITHVWNTEFELRGLDKNNPPAGSLLEELIK